MTARALTRVASVNMFLPNRATRRHPLWKGLHTLVVVMFALLVREGTGVAHLLAHARANLLPFRHDVLIEQVRKTARAALSPCPNDMALVDSEGVRVCVDRYEASLVETTPRGEQPWSPYRSVSGHSVRAVSQRDVVPQGYISRDEAELACGASGKRLCASEEWTTACQGPRQTTYPYGNAEHRTTCNDSGRSPLGALFSQSGARMYGSEIMNDPSLNALPGTVAHTGAFASCTNDFGVYDMVGNLHEWTADRHGTFRGGYFLDTTKNGHGCRYATTAHKAWYHDYSTGFRCCRDPR